MSAPQDLIEQIARPYWEQLVAENPELSRGDGPDWDFDAFCQEIGLMLRAGLVWKLLGYPNAQRVQKLARIAKVRLKL